MAHTKSGFVDTDDADHYSEVVECASYQSKYAGEAEPTDPVRIQGGIKCEIETQKRC